MLVTDLALVRAAHVILASASPRRVDILNNQLGVSARVVPSSFSEDLDKSAYTPLEYVKENARQKAMDVFEKCEKPFASKWDGRPPSLVIGADTVVVLDDKILEKPGSAEEARKMLTQLSAAGTHTVCTGVSLMYGMERHEHTFAEVTTVNFKPLSPDEIEAYVASGEPMDKAGAYGIQGLGGAFVSGVVGDYQNVVGFPLSRFCNELEVGRLSEWVDAAPPEELPPEIDDEPCDPLAPIISEECMEEDECGLPSD